jgi:hypothetical protein
VNSVPEDTHGDGAAATVVASAGPVTIGGVTAFVYVVEWDDLPGMPVHIAGDRLMKALGEERHGPDHR